MRLGLQYELSGYIVARVGDACDCTLIGNGSFGDIGAVHAGNPTIPMP